MQASLRTKLLAIVAMAAVAFIAVIVASSFSADRVIEEIERMRRVYVPLVGLGPTLERDFDALSRAYQDAVAAHDAEAVAAADKLRDKLSQDFDAAGAAVTPAKAEAARRAIGDYTRSAADVSRRLIAGETGEALVGAMGTMQTQQRVASDAIAAAAALDRDAFANAFTVVAEAQQTAKDIRLYVGIGCLALVLLFSLWLAGSVLRSLGRLDAGFARFGRGEFTPIPVVGSDELARAAERANDMAKNLERLAAEQRRTEWLEAGHVGLLRELRGELAPEEAAARALSFLARYLEVPVAALYQLDQGGVLQLRASHAPAELPGTAPRSFQLGEGLVGQAAKGEELVVLSSPPNHYLRARSALGEGAATTLVLVPLVRAGVVRGVIELGLFKPWSERKRDLLLATRETLAIALDVAKAGAETRALLKETQEQAARLERQDEELRSANEELHAQQEELRQSNQELLQQAEELEEQRRALTTVSAYKSQFLTNMSHELRTPLNSMLLLSNLMAENDGKNLTDKQVEFCRTIYSAGTDLLALINQVLDLAKVEAGKQEIRLGTVRLKDIAERARRVFEPLAQDKGLTLAVELQAGLPETIYTDQQRIDQIVTNLLGNAVKFSAAGTVTLRIMRPDARVRFARPELSHDEAVAFAVSDSGPGIAPEDQERIFAPFEQLDGKTDRRYGGTGLGLSLSRELAQLLGGEIQLRSTPGQGSTFVCYLPERPGRGIAPARPAPTDDDRQRLGADEPYLLVIEDDASFAATFGEVIHGHGLKYLVAESGMEARRLARDARPSGIIMDVKLPDTNGFALMEELRDDPATADIPVHFVSAIDAAERGLALGAVGYLVKPALRRDLVRVVESLVPRAATRACRILVVEDDVATGDTLLKMFAAEKLEARRVKSAGEALAALGEQRFECMVLDLTLPDMDGLQLLEKIQQDERPMPSVVVYTARALSKQEAKRLEAYTEAIVLKEGPSAERVINEIRLFVRRLKEGLAPRRAAVPAPTGDHGLAGKKALVVDDDMRTVYALSAALRGKGMEVFVADNGRAALEALALRPSIDIVLMDIMMPEMDGYEAMRNIRAESRFGALPIIALTAKAMKGDEEKCLEAGASAYLPKPIDATRLLALMRTQLRAGDGG